MSRTNKDKPDKIRFPKKDNWVFTEGYGTRKLPTIEPKKRKEVDSEWHWMGTPSAWTRLMMNRPQRRAGSLWERRVVTTSIDSIEEEDVPSVSRAPHCYYW
jgi:hypothetical protein